MSIAIGYTADLSDRRDLASEVIRYCEGLTKQHSWEMESFDLRSDFAAGRLEGRTKFMPLAADQVTAGFRDLYARLSKSCTPQRPGSTSHGVYNLKASKASSTRTVPILRLPLWFGTQRNPLLPTTRLGGFAGNGCQPRASGLLRRANKLFNDVGMRQMP